MVRSNHRELTLHRDGPLGDAALECKFELACLLIVHYFRLLVRIQVINC
jgi:hypothetical protein